MQRESDRFEVTFTITKLSFVFSLETCRMHDAIPVYFVMFLSKSTSKGLLLYWRSRPS